MLCARAEPEHGSQRELELRDRLSALLRAVLVPTAISISLLSLVVGGVFHLATKGSDDAARIRQTHLVEVALRQALADVRKNQEASTYWDDAVLRVRQRPLDLDWIDQNLGVWFFEYYKHDETYLLDGDDQPVYAAAGGHRSEPEAFRSIARDVRPLASDLREGLRTKRQVAAGSAEQSLGSADIAIVRGHPAIISVKPVVSETGEIKQRPGSEHLHVSVRYLDGSFLEDLASTYGIDHAAFAWSPSRGAHLLIRNKAGKSIGAINWRPFRPGGAVAVRVAPVLLAAVAVMGILLFVSLLRSYRSRLELEASRAQAQHLAFHDPLTGLPNRALLDDRLNHALANLGSGSLTVLLLDLDRFKHVNDTLGHLAGDALIREFGQRLTSLVRAEDTVSRLGGDEFAILLTNGPSKADVGRLCERIIGAVKEPFIVFGSEAHVGVSIGAVFAPEGGLTRTELLRKADIALYRAKDDGRDCHRFFERGMDETVQLRSTIEEDLRRALETNDQLEVHFQPQVMAAGGRIIGLEALVRWTHPTRGNIPPDQFIPIAEGSGLICALGEWVMERACRASLRWPHVTIALNLSPVQIKADGFYDRMMAVVEATGASPSRLELEVTENVLLADDDRASKTLARLRSAGFKIALDDFGTGYSSLSYLRKFEVDRIKIDRSFVQALGQTVDSTAIVKAILSLGQSLGLSITAEGVETSEQRAYLQGAGCNDLQGFLFAPALSTSDVDSLFAVGKLSSVSR